MERWGRCSGGDGAVVGPMGRWGRGGGGLGLRGRDRPAVGARGFAEPSVAHVRVSLTCTWDHGRMENLASPDPTAFHQASSGLDAREALVWLGAEAEFTRSAATSIDGLATGVRILTTTRLRQAQLMIARPDARVVLCGPEVGESEWEALMRVGAEQGTQWAVMGLQAALDAGAESRVAEAIDVGVLMPAPLQAAPEGWSLDAARQREKDSQLTTQDVALACEAAVANYLDGHIHAPLACLATATAGTNGARMSATAAGAGPVRAAVNAVVANGSRTLRQRAAGRVETLAQAEQLGERAAQALLDAGA